MNADAPLALKWEEGTSEKTCHFIVNSFFICCGKTFVLVFFFFFKVIPQYQDYEWIKGITVLGNATAPGKDTSQ